MYDFLRPPFLTNDQLNKIMDEYREVFKKLSSEMESSLGINYKVNLDSADTLVFEEWIRSVSPNSAIITIKDKMGIGYIQFNNNNLFKNIITHFKNNYSPIGATGDINSLNNDNSLEYILVLTFQVIITNSGESIIETATVGIPRSTVYMKYPDFSETEYMNSTTGTITLDMVPGFINSDLDMPILDRASNTGVYIINRQDRTQYGIGEVDLIDGYYAIKVTEIKNTTIPYGNQDNLVPVVLGSIDLDISQLTQIGIGTILKLPEAFNNLIKAGDLKGYLEVVNYTGGINTWFTPGDYHMKNGLLLFKPIA
jgi:hypothetical protein